MKTLFIATLIIFDVICLIRPAIGRNYGSDHPLCKPSKILGIFNLKEELFFQIRIGDRIDFWKLNDTEMEIEGKEDLIPKIHYNMSYLEEDFRHTIERETKFDLKQRIIGFVPIIEQIVHTCISKNDTQSPVCNEILEVNDKEFIDIICLFGFNKDQSEEQLIMPVRYDRLSGLLESIKVFDLKTQMRAKCAADRRAFMEDPNPTLMNAMVWQEINETLETIFRRNISLIIDKKSVPAKNLILFGYDSFINNSFHTIKGKYEMENIFRYNRHYSILTCPEDCLLNTYLGSISYKYENSAIGNTELGYYFELTNFAINDLLRCEYWERFEPQLFCEQKQNFDHIFNLGSDVYFQKSGHFWRYSSLGFTNEANKGFKQNITNIRFDSDLQPILEDQGFETNYPILGFSYKSIYNYHCDREPDTSKDCQKKYNITEHHYNVCIFGYKTGTDIHKQLEILPFHWTYILTPSGVSEWTEADETNSNTNYLFCTTLLSAMFVEIGLHNGTNELIGVASNDNYTIDKNEFYFLLRDRTSNKYKFLYYFIWRETKNPSSIGGLIASEELDENQMPINSLFLYNNQVYGYGNKRNGELFILDIVTLKLSPTNETIDSLFKCPFDQSFFAVNAEREDACPYGSPYNHSRRALESVERESVFTIGDHLYYQRSQQFFIYDVKYQRFLYDKYVSDLFGTYFATRERVTGYTVPKYKTYPNWDEYFVIIHGKSHQNFRAMGEYIFAAFDVKAEGLGTLIPVNDPKQLFNESVNSDQFISLGVKSDMFRNIGQSLIAIHYWRGKEVDFIVWIQRSDDHKIYHKFETIHRNQSMFPFIKDFQSDKWKNHSVSIADLQFNRILGLYSNDKWSLPLRLVAWSRSTSPELVIHTLSANTMRSVVGLKEAKHFTGFDNSFCSHYWVPSASGFGSAGYYILAILIFVLIVLAIVIGFVSYRRNQSKELNDKQSTDSQTLEQELSKGITEVKSAMGDNSYDKAVPKTQIKSKSNSGSDLKIKNSDEIKSIRSALGSTPKPNA